MIEPDHDRHELLRDFYRFIDAKRWDRAAAMLTDDCRWHILANDVVPAASVVGPLAVSRRFTDNLNGVETRQDPAHRGRQPGQCRVHQSYGDLGRRAEQQLMGRCVPP